VEEAISASANVQLHAIAKGSKFRILDEAIFAISELRIALHADMLGASFNAMMDYKIDRVTPKGAA
jgi:hypothetical protein